MALAIVTVDHDGTTGTVTLQSSLPEGNQAIMELQSGAARNKAIEAAAKEGLPDPRAGLNQAPYAVDNAGETVVRPTEQKVAAYRVDIHVTRRLV